MCAHSSYAHFATWLSRQTGRPLATALAIAAVVMWAATGPFFGFSDTWQLVINTATTVVTFLMVFIIQNSQMRDTQALQAKLDELIRASRGANDEMMDLEDLEEEELLQIHEKYSQLAHAARERLHSAEAATKDR